jgi:cobalt-zinc-cadmium efflux system outer membrane protein
MADEVVPAANDAFVATETGYSAGKFGFLNVLDAQRALFDVHSLLLDRREEYTLALIKLGRLTGDLPTGVGHAGPSDASGNKDGGR